MRRDKLRDKQASCRIKVTASVIVPKHHGEASESFDQPNAHDGNPKTPIEKPQSSQAFQQDQHHSDEPNRLPPSQSGGLKAEQILLQHTSRKSNVSDHKQEKLPKLNLPPSSDKTAWKSINEELAVAIPLVHSTEDR